MFDPITVTENVARWLVECALCGDRSGEAETPEAALALAGDHLATHHPKLEAREALRHLRLWTFQQVTPLETPVPEPEPITPTPDLNRQTETRKPKPKPKHTR